MQPGTLVLGGGTCRFVGALYAHPLVVRRNEEGKGGALLPPSCSTPERLSAGSRTRTRRRAVFAGRQGLPQGLPDQPASGYCDDSLLVEAEMYRKAAARFESERRRADALKTYRFLAREYPHSKLKPQALRAISEIEGGADPQHARNEPPIAPPPVANPAAKKVADLRPAPAVEPTAPAPIQVRHQPPRPRRGGLRSVDAVRFWSHADSTRIVIDVDDVTRYRFERLSNPDRLFVDLSNARLGPKFSTHRMTTLPVKDDRIGQIRVAQNRRKTVRVVFDLEQPVRPDFQWLPNPERLVIDLRSATEPPLFAEERPRTKPRPPVDPPAGRRTRFRLAPPPPPRFPIRR